jgi:hypothetical protein
MKSNLFRTINRPLFWKGLGIGCLACLIFVSCEKENSVPLDEEEDNELPLVVPTGLQHQFTDNSATLTWNTCPDVDGYEIDLNGTAYTSTTNSKEIGSLTSETNYTWKVRAVKGSRYSEWSQTEDFRTATTPLVVPTGLQHQFADNSATLTWNTCPGVDSYEIDLNGTVYTSTTNSTKIGSLTPETNYTWKVRAVKGSRYSEWSQTKSFRTTTTPLINLFAGNWSANNAVIYFQTQDYTEKLDGLLFRTHASGTPVTVAIAKNGSQPLMTVTGMDAYITGGTDAPSFDIDGQLVNLPLTVKDNEGTISASKNISNNNVYTASPNVKISDIPNYEELLGSNASIVKDNRIKTITFRIDRVSVIGALENNSNATYSFEYEIAITSITHDLNAGQKFLLNLAGINPDKLAELIPQPQLLLSDVACTK